MEREILIANTKTQKRSKVTTSATTLGELKADLRAAGIDYNGMTFTEGISKTQLLDDATQLPQNVMYKGQPTNNLVILLTNTKKNIASGTMSRKEVYQAIKDNNLQDAVKEEFGRNFTQVPTSDLLVFLAQDGNAEVTETLDDKPADTENNDIIAPEVKEKETPDTEDEDIPDYVDDIITDTRVDSTVNSLYVHIAMLVDNEVLSVADLEELNADIKYLTKVAKKEQNTVEKLPFEETPKKAVSTSDGSITDDDIDDMLDELGV
ncbi:hypothetical protein [Streptococcus vestibularis]|uniref:hypothetical protein n=1 Tax=Streptococcus vestibularis TaxID=1343 RepID=UPI0026F1E7C7|nr:hypothetical protein [Streptococcus vestibularis]